MLSIIPKSPKEIQEELKERFKALRLDIGYTQEALASRSGVSLGSLKRFEQSGEISLSNLLKLSAILDALGEFEKLFLPKETKAKSLEELIKSEPKKRKRGYKK
jgi:transcriptional regulator with XRE-family HTH domain